MCSPGQKVVIPKGLVQPDETIVVEIPPDLQNVDTVVAMPKCKPNLSKSFPRPRPKNYMGMVEQNKYQRRTTQNIEREPGQRPYCPMNRTMTPEKPFHRVGKTSPLRCRHIAERFGDEMYRPQFRNRQVEEMHYPYGTPVYGAFRDLPGSTPQPPDYIEGSLYRDFHPKDWCTEGSEAGSPMRSLIPDPAPLRRAPYMSPEHRPSTAPCSPENYNAQPPCIDRHSSMPTHPKKPMEYSPPPKYNRFDFSNLEDCPMSSYEYPSYQSSAECSGEESEVCSPQMEEPCMPMDLEGSDMLSPGPGGSPYENFQPMDTASFYVDYGELPPQNPPPPKCAPPPGTPPSFYDQSSGSPCRGQPDYFADLSSTRYSHVGPTMEDDCHLSPRQLSGGPTSHGRHGSPTCPGSPKTPACPGSAGSPDSSGGLSRDILDYSIDELITKLGHLEACEQEQILKDVVALQEARRKLILDTSSLSTAADISHEISQ